MIKIDYEKAWKELKENMRFSSLPLHMDEIEKHYIYNEKQLDVEEFKGWKLRDQLSKIIIRILIATQKDGLNEELSFSINELMDFRDKL
jgi:hypothetical protein